MSEFTEPIVFLCFSLINFSYVVRWIAKRLTGRKWEEQRPIIMLVYGSHIFISFGIIVVSMVETRLFIYLTNLLDKGLKHLF